MQTVIVTNNGYDSILLLDNHGVVIGAWSPAKAADITAYITDGAAPEEWEANHPDATAIEDYGQEAGRNGEMREDRRSFWLRESIHTQAEAEEWYKDSDGQRIPDGFHYCSGHNRVEADREACPVALANGEYTVRF